MKKPIFTLFSLATLLLLAVSCSSDDDKPAQKETEYYFRFKVNGEQVAYPYTPETQINLTGGYLFDEKNQLHVIQLSGTQSIYEPSRNQMVIYINSTSEFTTGLTYSNIESADVSLPFYLLMGYFDADGKGFSAAMNVVSTPLWENVYLKFDEINESGIKGTFSGKLYQYDTSSGQNVLEGEVQITAGEFHVPRNNEQ
ncbi:hypothetical protein LZF95_05655 [Algoriphagus sp. AGSA1]|uniref:hypothetical protein n=1 Tax=Algoriphagus sp. AGSA1 TaxID=2907213 RepID=UPI001F445020|nr:hypothetical protein [Algoriphagus sp. AGSA1]MCE7054151.1 hypothetical protein [Algoriphagus sp. AGSA1]